MQSECYFLRVSERYLYSNPKVDSSKPGQVWVDLQSVVEVEKDCPTCRLYVAYKCISPECHVSGTARETKGYFLMLN